MYQHNVSNKLSSSKLIVVFEISSVTRFYSLLPYDRIVSKPADFPASNFGFQNYMKRAWDTLILYFVYNRTDELQGDLTRTTAKKKAQFLTCPKTAEDSNGLVFF